MDDTYFDHLQNAFLCLYKEKSDINNLPEKVWEQLKCSSYRQNEGGLEAVVRAVIGNEKTDKIVNGLYKMMVPDYRERVYPDDSEVDIVWFSQGSDILDYLGLLVKAVLVPEEYEFCHQKSCELLNNENINYCVIVYLFITGEDVWIP